MKEKQKKSKQTSKQRLKEQGGTEALVKGWELNDFFVHLRYVFSNWYVKFRLSFINYFKRKRVICVKACCDGV